MNRIKTTVKYTIIFLLTFSISFANSSNCKLGKDCINFKSCVETIFLNLTHPIDTLKGKDDNTSEFLIKSHSSSWIKDHHYYSFEDEADVDDIPFNTKEVVNNYLIKNNR